MSNEADGWRLFGNIGGDMGHNIAVFVEGGLNAHIVQLFTKDSEKIQLFGCRGLALRLLVALGVHRYVAEKAF